jgi:uncharacterized damage-inducible protein DinB
MSDPRLAEIVRLLDPKPGTRQWFGGASPLGCLRGVSHQQAAWRPAPHRHSIWELTLHLAYWKYAVRRRLEGSSMGSFPRSPSNWPSAPDVVDARAWNGDRALLKAEHQRLVASVRAFDPKRLDARAAGSGTYRYTDLLYGIVMHDTYHVGQVQLLKRWYGDRARRMG